MKPLIKIPTRKESSYAEFQVVKNFLKDRDTFDTEEFGRYLNISLDREVPVKRLRVLIGILKSRKKAIVPTSPLRAGRNRQQIYKVINDNIEVTPPNSMKKKTILRKKIEKKPVEKTMLTLTDVERIGEMDLAFIGYTIRTEAEILSRKYEASLIQVKKAQEELEELKKNHIAEITTLVKHHKEETESLKRSLERSSDHMETIRNLNNRIINLNTINKNLKDDVERLENIVEQRSDKSFKLGEIAKFTKGKPSHLT